MRQMDADLAVEHRVSFASARTRIVTTQCLWDLEMGELRDEISSLNYTVTRHREAAMFDAPEPELAHWDAGQLLCGIRGGCAACKRGSQSAQGVDKSLQPTRGSTACGQALLPTDDTCQRGILCTPFSVVVHLRQSGVNMAIADKDAAAALLCSKKHRTNSTETGDSVRLPAVPAYAASH